jgi:hypothetical protein
MMEVEVCQAQRREEDGPHPAHHHRYDLYAHEEHGVHNEYILAKNEGNPALVGEAGIRVKEGVQEEPQPISRIHRGATHANPNKKAQEDTAKEKVVSIAGRAKTSKRLLYNRMHYSSPWK